MSDEQGGKHGFAAVLSLCADEQAAIQDEATAELFDDMPAPRGRGRPAGAHNKETLRQAELVKATGMSPLGFLASVWRSSAYGIDKRIAAASAALPYVHKKQPVSVDLNGKVVHLTIGSLGEAPAEAVDGGDLTLEGTFLEIDGESEQNQ